MSLRFDVALNPGITLTAREVVTFTADGASFTGTQRADRVPLTAVVTAPSGNAVVFSANGPIG